MNLKLSRAFWNPPFIIGLAIFGLGCGPLLVGAVLQQFGYFPGNTGLGLGLLFWFSVWPALAFIIGGIVVGVKRVDSSTPRHGAA